MANLTESEKISLYRHHYPVENSFDSEKIGASERAPTILARELTLRNWSTRHAAAKVGIAPERLAAIAEGSATPYSWETERLAKTFGESAELLTSKNTPQARARMRPLI